MSALTDVQDAFAITAAAVDAALEEVTTLSIDTPIEQCKLLLAYSVVRAAVVAALTASTTAQAYAAAGHVVLDAILTDVTTLSEDTPIEQLKATRTAFAAVGAAVAALT
jgi:hypothetical protein